VSAPPADLRAAWGNGALARLGRLRDGIAAMGWAELRKLRHDHLDIFTRSVQPLLWLFVFGTALRRNRDLSGGFHDYRAYLAPGVMAQAALFIAIFFGLAVIWERDVGQLQRLLATPIPRLAIVLGKATGAGVRALTQALVLLAVLAQQGLERIAVDHSFVSPSAIDVERGAFHQEVDQAMLKRTLVRIGRTSTLMADASKFSKGALHKVIGLEEVDHIVVDRSLEPAVLERMRDQGLPVEVAD
jgi:DeoR C terminal sensor domain/ABC-2 type transporter